MNTMKNILGPRLKPLAAFLEAKKAMETAKATQRAVTNCGRGVFRINPGTCKYILDSPSEKDNVVTPLTVSEKMTGVIP